MKEYKNEIIIAFIGAVLSLIQWFINAEFTFLILAFTLIIDIALISIKSDTEKYINSVDECQRLIGKIDDRRWKNEATEIYNETKKQLENMTSGNREIPISEINNQEMELMKSAKNSIHCIYYADSTLKLQMRLSTRITNPLSTIINGYRDIKNKNVEKQRVIVLSNIDFTKEENRTLLRNVNDFNTKSCMEGGLGFEMRYVLLSKLMEHQIFYVDNLLLVDNREATTVQDKTLYPDDYIVNDTFIVRDLICRGTIESVRVNELRRTYLKIWDAALPLERFLEGYKARA